MLPRKSRGGGEEVPQMCSISPQPRVSRVKQRGCSSWQASRQSYTTSNDNDEADDAASKTVTLSQTLRGKTDEWQLNLPPQQPTAPNQARPSISLASQHYASSSSTSSPLHLNLEIYHSSHSSTRKIGVRRKDCRSAGGDRRCRS